MSSIGRPNEGAYRRPINPLMASVIQSVKRWIAVCIIMGSNPWRIDFIKAYIVSLLAKGLLQAMSSYQRKIV